MNARTGPLHPGLDVLLGREDGRVVPVHDRFEEVPDRTVGGREVDVAAPDPLALATRALVEDLQERGGLWVMDHHDVEVVGELRRVRVHPLPVGLPHVVVQVRLGALQRVVDGLGDVEEPVRTLDHDPRRLDAEVVHQRDLRLEQLGDTAAVGGAADVQDPEPLELPRRLSEAIEGLLPCRLRVLRHTLGLDRDDREHARSLRAARGTGRRLRHRAARALAVGDPSARRRTSPGLARRCRRGRPGRTVSSGTRCTRPATRPVGPRAASWP